MTPAQTAALLALADLSGPTQRVVVASQVAHRLYGKSYADHGRGPGGRPATAARLLDHLQTRGLAAHDWTSTVNQRQWYITQAGLDQAAELAPQTA
jgi:hypothetical protein